MMLGPELDRAIRPSNGLLLIECQSD